MRFGAACLLSAAACVLASRSVHAIWPKPSHTSYGASSDDDQAVRALRVDVDKLTIDYADDLPSDLVAAIHRTKGRLKSDHFHPLIVGYGAARAEAVETAPTLQQLSIILDGADTQASEAAQSLERRFNPQFFIDFQDAREAATANAGERLRPLPGALPEATNDEEAAQTDSPLEQAHNANTDLRSPPGTVNNTGVPVPAPTRKGLVFEIQRDVELLEEAYSLSIPADGSTATLRARSSLGIFRGLTTFEQLFYSLPNASETARYIWNVPIEIHDEPAYPYRGIMVDTARNLIPIAALKRTIDAASYAKLNQFHWHIVDAQSFPLKFHGSLSVLAEKGAYSAGETYDAEDIRDFVQYAGERGINVNVEIDMPGHTYEGALQYNSEMLACPNQPDWARWANEPPSGQLALNSSVVDAYVKQLIQETAKLLAGPYFGHGNDEVNLRCYGASSKQEIDAALLKPFVEKVQRTIVESGKTPMVWEEAAIDFPETGRALVNGTIVEVWTGASKIAKVLSSNPRVRVITAPYQAAYLDVGQGSWLGGSTGHSYAKYVTWQVVYAFDPLDGTRDIPDARKRVLGGEINLWTEQADETNLDALLWPRALAGAEVYWTGEKWTESIQVASATSSAVGDSGGHSIPDGTAAGKTKLEGRSGASQQASEPDSPPRQWTKRSAVEALPRLHEQRYRLVARGIQAAPLQPKWCALRPNRCEWWTRDYCRT